MLVVAWCLGCLGFRAWGGGFRGLGLQYGLGSWVLGFMKRHIVHRKTLTKGLAMERLTRGL